ncbi:hypothetical protein KUTeg_001015 [Tegillarca granosa]|uniref:DDE Tnp4 domain-containing protein n=1 Tax=Tegillarca granosa TaxID=220873 RepID=A0ABQ9FW58_TEGGR|nr:hypothetical protein KUTeg_001015 [Tegillarca granosa]
MFKLIHSFLMLSEIIILIKCNYEYLQQILFCLYSPDSVLGFELDSVSDTELSYRLDTELDWKLDIELNPDSVSDTLSDNYTDNLNLTFLRQVPGNLKYLSLTQNGDVLRLLERLENIERNRNVRRVFVDRQNPLECLEDEEIFVRYRFRSRTILYITDLLSDRLMHPTRRSLPLTPLLQVLVFVRILASGAFHLLIGVGVNISKAIAGRCIRRVAEAISSLAGKFIVFPTGNGIVHRKSGFCAVAGFPNVIGCIDGTQVRIT